MYLTWKGFLRSTPSLALAISGLVLVPRRLRSTLTCAHQYTHQGIHVTRTTSVHLHRLLLLRVRRRMTTTLTRKRQGSTVTRCTTTSTTMEEEDNNNNNHIHIHRRRRRLTRIITTSKGDRRRRRRLTGTTITTNTTPRHLVRHIITTTTEHTRRRLRIRRRLITTTTTHRRHAVSRLQELALTLPAWRNSRKRYASRWTNSRRRARNSRLTAHGSLTTTARLRACAWRGITPDSPQGARERAAA